MIKVHGNKIGGIYIEENYLINSLKELVKYYFNEKSLINVSIETKRYNVESVLFSFEKEKVLSSHDKKNLFDEISFVLSNKFGIKKTNLAFIYENRN